MLTVQRNIMVNSRQSDKQLGTALS